jgi:tetratricopeptide (TPR) repeat protein
MLNHEKTKNAEATQSEQTRESILEAIRVQAHAAAKIEAQAVAKRWFALPSLISCIALVCSVFMLYLYATQSRPPAQPLSPLSGNSAEYLKDRLDDLAQSQQWVLLIFGGIAALITLLGASFQWLQYTEGRREREVKEPGQETMLRQVNEVIDTVGKTLAFRLREEEELREATETLKKLEKTVNVLRTEASETFNQLKLQLPAISAWSRITFTSLNPMQEASATRFLQQFRILPNWFRRESQEDLAMGQATYFAGVIAFVNNDIAYAMNLLDEAKRCRDRNSSSQDEQLQLWGAFVTYWMGLVERNWGSLDKAREYFDDSLSRFGPHGKKIKKDEWLTRLSLTEILMYDQTTRPVAKKTVEEILNEIGKITKETRTETKMMWARAKLISANGEMADGNFTEAKANYEEVLQVFPENYYALFSSALCLRKSGIDVTEATKKFAETLKLIHASGDLRTKKELGPLAGLYYVTMRATQWSDKKDLSDEHKRQLYELLDPRRTVFNSYQLRIFVPDKVRLMLAEELRGSLTEV